MIARYNSNGSLDTSFDGDGRITTDFFGFIDVAQAIAVQTDGKIAVAGFTETIYGGGYDFALARYNANGSLDTNFDGDGKLTANFTGGELAYDLVIQPDGKIVVVGNTFTEMSGGVALVRFNTNGSLDTSFGTNGKVVAALGNGRGTATSVALQSNGKIVIGGYGTSTMFDEDFFVARLESNGQLDATFGTNGVRFTDMSGGDDDAALDIALQMDGKIVAVGYAVMQTGNFAMTRYTTDGNLDTNFGNAGKVITEFDEFSSANRVVIQADGKIVSAGYATRNVGAEFNFGLSRHNSNGSLDTSFGSGGKVITEFATGFHRDEARGVVIQPDGKIIAAGNTSSQVATDFALARYISANTPVSKPFDFDGDGKTDISIFRPAVGEWWYLKSSNGGNAVLQFGTSTDKLTPADYTGDGKTDIAFFRPSTGFWFVLRSEDNSFFSFPFGTNGDIPVPGDYDGDGRADAAVFRPSTNTWFISPSTGGTRIEQFGTSGDIPVAADYDGDGRSDIAIFRPSNGQWWLSRSTAGTIVLTFGVGTDKAVQGDYTGDGKADVAFWRPSTGEWFVLRSEDFSFFSAPFGTSGDVPAPGDYDGDGKFDFAVFRPSNSIWFVQRSTSGTLIQPFGQTGDIPVPSAFVP